MTLLTSTIFVILKTTSNIVNLNQLNKIRFQNYHAFNQSHIVIFFVTIIVPVNSLGIL